MNLPSFEFLEVFYAERQGSGQVQYLYVLQEENSNDSEQRGLI